MDDPLVALLSAAEYGPRDASTESRIHDRKLGHVTCGFSGHGVNSNYFEYQCRLPHFVTRLCAVRTSVAAVKLPLLTDADCAAALALIRSCARRERERDG